MDKIKYNLHDITSIYYYNKNNLSYYIKKKWPLYGNRIYIYFLGGINKGLFDLTSRKMMDKYDIKIDNSNMDAFLLYYYNKSLVDAIRYLERVNIESIDSDYDLYYFNSLGSKVGQKIRSEFISDVRNKKHVTPNTYLCGINDEKYEFLRNIELVPDDFNTGLRNTIEENILSCEMADLTLERKVELIDSSKKNISCYVYTNFRNEKFSGDAISALYRGYFGMESEKVISRLKNSGIRVYKNSLVSAMPAEEFDMYLVMIDLLSRNLTCFGEKFRDERCVNGLSYLIGSTGRSIFRSDYGIDPIDYLTEYNLSPMQRFENVERYDSIKRVRKNNE